MKAVAQEVANNVLHNSRRQIQAQSPSLRYEAVERGTPL